MRKLIAFCAIVVAALLIGNVPAHAQPRPLRVAIVGDSFSAGIGASNGYGGYATLLGARGCWELNLVARSGSGYAASTDPFVSVPRVAAVATSLPDVIIVQGSGNDRGDGRLFAAATGLYLTYRVVAPQARIVVVGPTGAPDAKHGNIDEIRRHLRDAAGVAGVTFLDPKAERWLNPATDYAPDGIHPNNSGHARLADRLFSALSGLGVAGTCG
ncbi:SGNH/GDSL hydrolase family protein [Rhodococcoides fascians]|uniref:SGNH/GDSL hydrolase family protein n=1 Tax=Rhodococcoides fascians TaxID=1828 RepID=UPI00056717DE|nr:MULTISPECIES: SGNH/GDSL hydrolase family protein [Rhodococcus]OZF03609.1 SGNH/GDSL hydrolase family protein [Rhodococcus sp. 15-1189-1-1a]OZF17414.1 SGNH/GDSL hydrolase family protein [Rhodococcus sp. 14-2686-1-2]